jgi:hypothetical protein
MRRSILVLALLILLAAVSVGCVSQTQSRITQAEQPQHLAVEASVIKLSPQELFRQSDAVIVGVVTGMPRSSRIPGPRTDAEPEGLPRVVTDWTVVTTEVLKGTPPKHVSVRLEGGSTPDLTVDFTQEADLSSGDRVLLYLRSEGDHYRVNGLFQGKYAITDSGLAKNRESERDEPLSSLKLRNQP